MTPRSPLVFLVDVDNTLLDNDRLTEDLRRRLETTLGREPSDRYFAILDEVSAELGFRDYLGALQRLRVEMPRDMRLMSISGWLLAYPFAERLYAGALDVLAHLGAFGPTVILSDGDAVFQPRKIARSGIAAAVADRVLVYVHKELVLDDVERRYPAERYVLIDDKPRILAAVKQAWGERVLTVLPRQGHYALDPAAGTFGAPDATLAHLAELLTYGKADFETTR